MRWRSCFSSGTKFGKSARDPRSYAAGFKRKSIAAVSFATGAVGAVSTKRTETKQSRKAERAQTGKRSIQKSMLVVDGEDIDRDADCSDDEWSQFDFSNDFSFLTLLKFASVWKYAACHYTLTLF